MSNISQFGANVEQAVRDLQWVLLSPCLLQTHADLPPLVTDEQLAALRTPALCTWLSELAQAPQSLLRFLQQHPQRRLGLYFESLWAFIFTHAPGLQLLAHNLTIAGDKRTLGALDFIWQQDEAVWHWEVAVKFYLYHPERTRNWHAFVGPEGRDTLGQKLERLKSHQLPLLQHAAAQPTLAALPQVRRQACLLKGYLFYPWPQGRSELDLSLSPNHLYGFYLHHSALESLLASYSGAWLVLPKPLWLAPACCAKTELAALNADRLLMQVRTHFAQAQAPAVLLVNLKIDGASLQENARFMIVSQEKNQ